MVSQVVSIGQYLPSSHFIFLNRDQAVKVASVALASLAMFSLQLQCSLLFALKISSICSTVTLISEKLKNQDSNWFSPINQQELFPDLFKRLLLFPICTGLFYTAFGLPVLVVAQKILFCDLRVIFMTTAVAPVVEEVLFRGFIQERIEDMTFLTNRYVYPLSAQTREKVSCATQAIFFGLCHLPGKQVIGSFIDKLFVCSTITFSGYCYGKAKNKDQSLLSSIALHAIQNVTLALGLLTFKPFILGRL